MRIFLGLIIFFLSVIFSYKKIGGIRKEKFEHLFDQNVEPNDQKKWRSCLSKQLGGVDRERIALSSFD